MNNTLRVGIDIGSTTIKMVVLNEENSIVFQHYARHYSNITNAFKEVVLAAQPFLQQQVLSIMLTGSSGMGVSQALALPFTQEVIAATIAIRQVIPATNTAIELGGEDAKITYFDGTVEQRMNGVCAGGTGAFIDHMAALLHTDPLGLNELAKSYTTIHPIASRCGVFAKTDVQALMNEGVSKEDIAASVLQAVVNQTISSLAQGRAIRGKVAFLGGPLYFLPELLRRFTVTLGLTDDNILAPECSPYFVAMGAALAPRELTLPYELLQEKVLKAFELRAENTQSLAPLFKDEKEYQQFINRHKRYAVKRSNLEEYAGNAYLGIDAGSTTTKLTLIGEDTSLLYSYYASNQGNPLETVVAALKDLFQRLNDRTKIVHSAVTGYGEQFIKTALQVDIGEVETVAHLKAAKHFSPNVTFVLDIGGQDMKSFFIKNGIINSITLNEACSAGCGSFIENFAQAVNMSIKDFSQLGLKSQKPADLGSRCTVFMNSKVKQVQKEGAELSDISAGISVSIVKNALFKVIRVKNTNELGDQVVVQGGTFYNDAVLRVLEQIIGREVVRPDIAGLMGAFGAALIAKESYTTTGITTTLLSLTDLDNFSSHTTSARCQLCGNKCLITTQHFSNSQQHHFGNRCEQGIGKTTHISKLPNLYAYKYKRLFQYHPLPDALAHRGVIGIPRVLNMYEDYPFWFTFFTKLNYQVVLSGRSSRQLYEQGMETIPSESICYPAKLVHGHIRDLIKKGVKKIFYPCIPNTLQEDVMADNCYNCPIVTSYPQNIKANMDMLRDKEILFLHPFLPLNNRDRLIKRLTQELGSENISRREVISAVDEAYAELERYKADVQAESQEALNYIADHNIKGVVLAGRPYHIDPEINHGLPELIQSYGLAVLSEDGVRHLSKTSSPLRVVNQWTYHSRLYAAAEFVTHHPNVELIQINSFGCGLDAVTIDQVKEIIENHNRTYTVIKLDEISSLGSVKIRIRSLLAAINNRDNNISIMKQLAEIAATRPPIVAAEINKQHTILAPQLSPIHFQFLESAFQTAGYKVVVAPIPDKAAIDEGLKYVHNDACYPTIIVVGQLVTALKSGQYDLNTTSVLLAQTGGGCRATNYPAIARKAFEDAGIPQVPVFVLGGKDQSEFPLTLRLFKNLLIGTIYGDLLMRVLHRIRPYEKQPGSAQKLYEYWAAKCKQDMLMQSKHDFKNNIFGIVRDFDNLEIDEQIIKPRVGIVGEILVKYHPTANNNIVDMLEREGAEVVVPDMLEFFLYCAYDSKVHYDLLSGTWMNKFKGDLFIKAVEFYRRHLRTALKNSKRFAPPHNIEHLANMAAKHLSLGNHTGEGWLLTGEMLELIHCGVENIACLQPFACLPNHITGKGMLKELRNSYPHVNIIPIDYDPGASEVNQLNRIKLMLAIAKEKIAQSTDCKVPV
ncbi:acyl-CoA dehydratase activase-related protein [Dendrosporobacter sp. 1207_IL3150]|uniref:acyl-CoA dehydratase activase-related protein n=1 Tax=Dendrosporobacter sp. 1207_IL3150 TaxID=3084054 RepID=UPI002FDABD5E